MAALWGGGQQVGFLGTDLLGLAGALCDIAWLLLLAGYVLPDLDLLPQPPALCGRGAYRPAPSDPATLSARHC
ncbi:MAG: hypothetical protein J0H34_01850 [Rhizobiales bacterium]|nr:hypothetical protein [Hyphomicrobiales bacterium]